MDLCNRILLHTLTAHNGKQKTFKRFICLKHQEWGEKLDVEGDAEIHTASYDSFINIRIIIS